MGLGLGFESLEDKRSSPPTASLGSLPGLASSQPMMQRWEQNLEVRATPALRSLPHWMHTMRWLGSDDDFLDAPLASAGLGGGT